MIEVSEILGTLNALEDKIAGENMPIEKAYRIWHELNACRKAIEEIEVKYK